MFGVPVMFMVAEDNREEAARYLAEILSVNNDRLLVSEPSGDRYIDSWWFIEKEDKHIDNNDNIAYVLVEDEEE